MQIRHVSCPRFPSRERSVTFCRFSCSVDSESTQTSAKRIFNSNILRKSLMGCGRRGRTRKWCVHSCCRCWNVLLSSMEWCMCAHRCRLIWRKFNFRQSGMMYTYMYIHPTHDCVHKRRWHDAIVVGKDWYSTLWHATVVHFNEFYSWMWVCSAGACIPITMRYTDTCCALISWHTIANTFAHRSKTIQIISLVYLIKHEWMPIIRVITLWTNTLLHNHRIRGQRLN